MAEKGDGGVTTAQLCEVSRRVTGVTGAGILLMSDDVPLGSVCAANDVSALIENLQYTLGEGPCVDAHRLGRPVLEPDLANPAAPRWLAFTGPAVDAGVRAIFGFPIAVGSVHMGALNLYMDTAGPLTDEQHADALVMAEIAGQAVLVMQTDCSVEPRCQALGIRRGSLVSRRLEVLAMAHSERSCIWLCCWPRVDDDLGNWERPAGRPGRHRRGPGRRIPGRRVVPPLLTTARVRVTSRKVGSGPR